ncbi:hypothetical protein DTO164E3_7898 [Paecilomyces variotii]|nr:hypothetical protein DTO164E3_7898 [Paecilomyces variotii]KAJ9194620.1 hypothetical protein DTO032I3_7235 [Paecilomyces variotii]KAJ9249378.1 hypothetical protein DTO207G8_6764 [Paecilomyces variotii]KAJ9275500.1 hypothetical protein DTO021D3_7683 [Paecilomyces variotii]KAJ9283353.1 hypothetical protein DTO021C3_9070 [Paecilomyces variotii]
MDSAGSQDKKPIPKFSSFKPKPAPKPEADKTREHRRRESPVSGRREHHEPSRHRSRHRSHRHRSRSVERSPDRGKPRPTSRKQDYTSSDHHDVLLSANVSVKGEDDSNLFVVDRKGDRYNITYGTLHRYSVPQYHRIGQGSVLGLPPSYKIDRDAADGAALVITADTLRGDSSRSKIRSTLSKLNRQQPRLLRIRQLKEADPTEATRDFLPLSSSGSRKRRKILGTSDSEESDRYAYRSIEGKAKPGKDLPSDLEEASDSDSGEEGRRIDPDEEIKQHNIQLSRTVEDHPDDVDAWLRLINHQDALLAGVGRDARTLSYAEQRSLADIKLSLYDKALRRVGRNPLKDRLLLGFLEEGRKLWDTKKLSTQWHSVLKANPGYISLWVKYLDFRQTEFLDFTYDKCKGTFLECMKLNSSSLDNPEKARTQTYLFLRMTVFMRQSGFAEHAVGLWQAILEFVFFRPEVFNGSDDLQAALSSFMEFWESEVARIGELGAKGWKSGNSTGVQPQSTVANSRIHRKRVFGSWLECEKDREMNARLPARVLDEFEEDDPYRVVLFSDLQDFLTLFWNLASREVLIDAFVHFCSLPAISTTENTEVCRHWCGDAFLRNELVDISGPTLDEWLCDSSANDNPMIWPSSSIPGNYVHTLDTLLSDKNSWFDSLKLWRDTVLHGKANLEPDWVRRTIRGLVDATPGHDLLPQYSLALEYAFDFKEARKYAKSLLKRSPSNMRLYNAYGLIELRSGNAVTAEKVWMTTLSMSRDFSDTEKLSCALLWRTWIWECLHGAEVNKAIRLLLSIPQNAISVSNLSASEERMVISPAEFLKTQRSLSEGQEQALAMRNAEVFVAYTECLAILKYLSYDLSIDDAITIFSTAFERLGKLPPQATSFVSFATELLHQMRAKLLYYHTRSRRAYKPSQIRGLLLESISLFPHNTIFLNLFAWNESRFRIEERVRDVIHEITAQGRKGQSQLNKQAVPVTSHFFAVYAELHRPVFSGSTIHSVRAAFEKAISDPTLRSGTSSSSPIHDPSSSHSNISLWKLYILFELSRGHIARAKDIFFRAMRACPWSKQILMLAFSHLRADLIKEQKKQDSAPTQKPTEEGMSFEELRRVYNVLVEKELRLHVDIEDVLEDIEDQMEQKRTMQGQQGMNTDPINMPEDPDSEQDIM